MDGKTHAPIGTATALLVMQPTKPEDIIVTAAVGAFSGLLADVDVGGKVVHYIKRIIEAFIGIIAFFMIQALVTGDSMVNSINRSGFAINLLGLAMLIAFSIYGGTQPHRGFTHSIIACIAASACAYLIFGEIAKAFVAGYVSHIVVDLFNKKGEQLLWPLKGRWCFGLCTASGVVDISLRAFACIVSVGYLAFLGL